jgi:hypothetical protein
VDDDRFGLVDLGHREPFVFAAVFRCALPVDGVSGGVNAELHSKPERPVRDAGAGLDVSDERAPVFLEEQVEGACNFDAVAHNDLFVHSCDRPIAVRFEGLHDCCDVGDVRRRWRVVGFGERSFQDAVKRCPEVSSDGGAALLLRSFAEFVERCLVVDEVEDLGEKVGALRHPDRCHAFTPRHEARGVVERFGDGGGPCVALRLLARRAVRRGNAPIGLGGLRWCS